jgi:ERCC4-type nuclease
VIIIQDTREQNGWDTFLDHRVDYVERCKLDEGDYTTTDILSLEKITGRKILRIERKASTGELAANLGQKRVTFEKELVRLSEYEHKYLIMEFDEDTVYSFPYNSGIPERKWYRINKQGKKVRAIKMNGPYMVSLLSQMRDKYGIELIYAGNKENAKLMALELMYANF